MALAKGGCDPCGRDRLRVGKNGRKSFEQPVKENFTIVSPFDVATPNAQRWDNLAWDVERAIVRKKPPAVGEGLRVIQTNELFFRQLEWVRCPTHMS